MCKSIYHKKWEKNKDFCFLLTLKTASLFLFIFRFYFSFFFHHELIVCCCVYLHNAQRAIFMICKFSSFTTTSDIQFFSFLARSLNKYTQKYLSFTDSIIIEWRHHLCCKCMYIFHYYYFLFSITSLALYYIRVSFDRSCAQCHFVCQLRVLPRMKRKKKHILVNKIKLKLIFFKFCIIMQVLKLFRGTIGESCEYNCLFFKSIYSHSTSHSKVLNKIRFLSTPFFPKQCSEFTWLEAIKKGWSTEIMSLYKHNNI